MDNKSIKIQRCNEKSISGLLVITGGSIGNMSVISNINKLLEIVKNLSKNVYLITFCDKDQNYGLANHNIYSINNYGDRIINFFNAQISVSVKIVSLRGTYDAVLYTFGQDLLIVPVIFSKCLGKKIIIRSDGRPSIVMSKYLKDNSFFKYIFFRFLEKINYSLADVLLTECNFMLKENKFDRYSNSFVGRLYIESRFRVKNPLNQRCYDIGYIGRFHPEKGIENLIAAVPSLFLKDPNIRILIGGGGELEKKIESKIKNINFSQNIYLKKWISRDDMPVYLNNIKILIIPSYKEGLPNILLEAMACGTVVLATPVGGIPGIIIDGKTGFIMENNSLECIVENVIRALNSPNLAQIAENGKRFVEENFTFEKTVENWKKAFRKIE